MRTFLHMDRNKTAFVNKPPVNRKRPELWFHPQESIDLQICRFVRVTSPDIVHEGEGGVEGNCLAVNPLASGSLLHTFDPILIL